MKVIKEMGGRKVSQGGKQVNHRNFLKKKRTDGPLIGGKFKFFLFFIFFFFIKKKKIKNKINLNIHHISEQSILFFYRKSRW